MNLALRSIIALGILAAAPFFVADDCPAATPDVAAPAAPASEKPTEPAAPAGHPLRGVIVAILPEKSALLVKHEEIPDVMDAMTMLLKVDATTLAAAKKDQAITGTLIKKANGWWLENVQPAPAPAP